MSAPRSGAPVLAIVVLVAGVAFMAFRDDREIKRLRVALHQEQYKSDSLEARNRCLESAGIDCTEPLTVGGDKLPYGRRP